MGGVAPNSKDTQILTDNQLKRSGGSRSSPEEYIYTPFSSSGRGTTLALHLTQKRASSGWPWLLAVSQPADGCGGLWAAAASLPVTKEPERSGGWPGRRSGVVGMAGSGADATAGRCAARRRSGGDRHRGVADGLPGLSRDGSRQRPTAAQRSRPKALAHRSGAGCGGLVLTHAAPAAGTAASWAPGRLPAGLAPAEVWRNRRSEREQSKLACYAEPQGGKARQGLIAPRYNQAAGLPRSGGTGLF